MMRVQSTLNLNKAQAQNIASVLAEALPYIQRFPVKPSWLNMAVMP